MPPGKNDPSSLGYGSAKPARSKKRQEEGCGSVLYNRLFPNIPGLFLLRMITLIRLLPLITALNTSSDSLTPERPLHEAADVQERMTSIPLSKVGDDPTRISFCCGLLSLIARAGSQHVCQPGRNPDRMRELVPHA